MKNGQGQANNDFGKFGMWKDNAGQTNKRIRKTARLSSRSLFLGFRLGGKDIALFRSIVKGFIEEDEWILDGNYIHTLLEERLEKCDRVIFLDYSRVFSVYRVIKRYFIYRNSPAKTSHQLPGQTFLVVYQMGVGIQNAGASDFDYGFKPNEVGRKRCLDF